MKCLECEHYKLMVDYLGYADARCFYSVKRGKGITWAHTTLNSPNIFDVHSTGKTTVMGILTKQKKPPYWCKLK